MHRGCRSTLAIGSKRWGAAASAASLLLQPASASTRTGARIRMVFSSGGAELLFQRQLADALAGRGKDRVRERRSGDRGSRLADSARGLQVAHEVHFDLRRLVDPQRSIIVEVGLLDPALLERHLAPQGAADPEDDPPFGPRPDRVWVPDRSAVDPAAPPVPTEVARAGNLAFRHFGEIA